MIAAQPLDTNVSAGASELRSPRGRQMGADRGWHSQVPLLGEMTYKIGSTFRSSTRHGRGAARQRERQCGMRHAEITACRHNASEQLHSRPSQFRPGQSRGHSRIVNCTCRLLLRSTACGGGGGRAGACSID